MNLKSLQIYSLSDMTNGKQVCCKKKKKTDGDGFVLTM